MITQERQEGVVANPEPVVGVRPTIAPELSKREARHAEVPKTIVEPTPQALGLFDQLGLWGNLGVSLLGFGGALAIIQPDGFAQLSLVAALCALVLGTILGTLAVSLSAIPGAQTGAPAMVLLRGVFGIRLSWLPTLLNIMQCIGWGVFELVIIADGAEAVTNHHGAHWIYVVAAGVLTTAFTLRPLGAVRILRRFIAPLVVVAMVYFAVQLLRQHLPSPTAGSWGGFWPAADVAVAAAVSWVPLVSDYSRHSRSPRTAFAGSFIGNGVSQIACYAIGLVALSLVAFDPNKIFNSFIALPLGALFFAILVLRESDQSFVNVYSTAVSMQNLYQRGDRRVLAVAVGIIITVIALAVDITQYQGFLYVIGSVFVPLAGVVIADYFFFDGRHRWDLSLASGGRWHMLIPWILGVAMYQLINPGTIAVWSSFWTWLATHIGFTAQPWMSASVLSFVVAVVATVLINASVAFRRRPRVDFSRAS
jgi:putative hydroxymethylpyrimidine transporter CytX